MPFWIADEHRAAVEWVRETGNELAFDVLEETLRSAFHVDGDDLIGLLEFAADVRPQSVGSDNGRPADHERFRLAVLTARAIVDLPDPPVSDELLGPLVLRGARTIIGAHTGEGKTSISLQVLRAIIAGEAFLDQTGIGGKARALVIDLEQGLRSVKRRLRELGLEESESLDYLRVPDGLALDRSVQQIGAVEEILAAGNYDAVLLDPLYKAHTGDSNAEREAVDLMRILDAWRARYGFALLLPVHLRKPVPGLKGFTIHDIFGSSAYVRGAEIVLGLQRLALGLARLYYLKDRDGDLPVGEHRDLLFDREGGFTLKPGEDPEPAAAALAETRARVLAYVRENPGSSQRAVESGAGGNATVIRQALDSLVREEAIEDRGTASRKSLHARGEGPLEARPEELEWER